MDQYRRQPQERSTMPPGIPYIISNEAAERFSYYGMRAILVVFMTQYLRDASGGLAPMGEVEARVSYHLFSTSVYFFPLLGALVADALWGKYRTILVLSIVYCLGHAVLALDETRVGLTAGLALIAVGSGGIKPCVAAHVGDQFGPRNQRLLSTVFMAFYWAINLGAIASQLATPWLLEQYGPSVAFGVPGVLMALATGAFWLGRHKFVHIPAGGRSFLREAFSLAGAGTVARLAVVYAFVAVFWSLFDQTGSAWVQQAIKMDTTVLGIKVLPSQVQSFNPFLILLFIPLFNYVIYPALGRVIQLTPLRKILMGLFVMVPAFVIPALVETQIEAGQVPNIGWHLLAYVLVTAAEVMISITCLEYSYTQAPRSMKSVIMGLFYLSISAGNAFTSLVNLAIADPAGGSRIAGSTYYYFFVLLMLATALGFLPVQRWLERTAPSSAP